MSTEPYSNSFNNRHHTEIKLWKDTPLSSWTRERGKTSILIIDDDFLSEDDLFAGSEHVKQAMLEWLNAEAAFCSPPAGYDRGRPDTHIFTSAWLQRELQMQILPSSNQIAAIFLDLHFGQRRRDSEGAQGFHFLKIIKGRAEFRDIPTFIMSTVDWQDKVRRELADSGPYARYITKDASRNLTETIIDAVVEFGLISDPEPAAFSLAARRVVQELRQISIRAPKIFAEDLACRFPQPVLFVGESGSGKTHFARHLWKMSSKRENYYKSVPRSESWILTGQRALDADKALFVIDRETGARLMPSPKLGENVLPMSQVGLLHEADVPADRHHQPPSVMGFKSRKGGIFVGEICSDSEGWQDCLRDWLRHGRITPVGESHLIPEQRCMNVWLLLASRSDLYLRLSVELRDCLQRAHKILLPSLEERSEDVIIQAAQRMANGKQQPEDWFHSEALHLLRNARPKVGFRELLEILERLDRSFNPPFRKAEVESALRDKQSRSVSG